MTNVAEMIRDAVDYHRAGDLDLAEEHYRRILDQEPENPCILHLLGALAHQKGRNDVALDLIERAISGDDGVAEFHNTAGVVLQALGRSEESAGEYRRAILLRPDYAEAYNNMAMVLQNQAVACLLNGDFCRGWKEFEWRRKTDWHVSAYPHKHDKPRWNGESFVEKRLLIHCEQGVGDCLQFVRYLPMVKKLGGTVIFEAWKSLHGLLKDFDGIDELAETWHGLPARETRPGLPRAKPRGCLCHGQTQAQFDARASIMDLPGVFTTTEHTIPRSVPYIHADPIKSEYWAQELLGSELKVGIVWAGSARHSNDRNRSCKLSHFGPLGQIEGVGLFGLQKGEPARQADGGWVTNLGERFDDFTDTAAAIANLDLVISVDTAVLHLAGAMGKPVWALLPFAPDWRWMIGRADSPWYPTMRLFRQKQWGDWDSVFTDVTRELRILVHRRKQGADR